MTPEPHPFTPVELERLAIYREAVRAGFYTDWPGHTAFRWPNPTNTAPKPTATPTR